MVVQEGIDVYKNQREFWEHINGSLQPFNYLTTGHLQT